MFLTGFFRSPPQNFHTTEKVEIDIRRNTQKVAVVVKDLSTGARMNESSKFVNKAFTPPIFKEQGAINAFDMIKRAPGETPFTDPNFAVNASREAFVIFRSFEDKIRRSIELMSSQVLQHGTVTLTDETGLALYELDFGAKTSHMATVTTPWVVDGTTGNPLADLAALAEIVRRDGKRNPTRLVFGTSAFQRFIANTQVAKILFTNFHSPGMGQLAPQSPPKGLGGSLQGRIFIGAYEFELWTYNDWFEHPVTGVLTNYVDTNNVIMLSDGRLDLTYGAIPRIVAPEQRAMPFLPPRMSAPDQGLDLTVNAWVTSDGESLMVSAGTRPLTIPTAIDTYARLTVA
jgi:uncharacterized protein YbaA (DUF1428 family)